MKLNLPGDGLYVLQGKDLREISEHSEALVRVIRKIVDDNEPDWEIINRLNIDMKSLSPPELPDEPMEDWQETLDKLF